MRDELYPLQFEPYFKESLWGGRKLETLLGRRLPPGKSIGESWEIADCSIVRNGPLAGSTLADVVRKFGKRLLGGQVSRGRKFPLLLKLSTTELDLSVQVHPDDAQARSIEPRSGFPGKTEMIYVLDAEPKARVLYGFRERIDRAILQAHSTDGGAVVAVLQELRAEPGDVILVSPGTVHAYGAGLVYFELQQNSDITYRLFDWNRVDADGRLRELHIAEALDVVDYQAVNPPKITPVCVAEEWGQRCILAACRYFLTERLELVSGLLVNHSGGSFHILSVIDGCATLYSSSRTDVELRINSGDVVLLPAAVAEYSVLPEPTCRLLRSYVPELGRDVVNYLLGRGIAAESVLALGGGALSKNDLAPLLCVGNALRDCGGGSRTRLDLIERASQ